MIDSRRGLDATDIAILAVMNSPLLIAARDAAGVAEAQAFAAQLLPDPQFALTRDYPYAGIDTSQSLILGLSYDWQTLISHSAAKAAASAAQKAAHLTVLWQEWQVIAAAKTLAIRSVIEQKKLHYLTQEVQALSVLVERIHRAAALDSVTLDEEALMGTTLADAQGLRNTLQIEINQTQHDLHALLNLSPDVSIPLRENMTFPVLNHSLIAKTAPQLARARPDLLALQEGYLSQEYAFKKAVLDQFPSFSIGVHNGRDTSDVKSVGFDVLLNLPILNANKGAVAITKATRQQLYDEYQTRLNTAYSDIDRLLKLDTLLVQERQVLINNKVMANRLLQADKKAFFAKEADLRAYVADQQAAWNAAIALLDLEQTIQEERIALQSLIGSDLRCVSLLGEQKA